MAEQVYFEDIAEGGDVTPLAKLPTTRQLVMWAGASGDYNPIHYDKDYALGRGLSGVVVPGQLVCAFLGQMVTDWMGEQGTLKKLSCSYKGMNYPGEAITCKGEILKKLVADGKHCVECSIWAENARGEKTVTGSAVVVLPSRN
jgi:acyl dehydratase